MAGKKKVNDTPRYYGRFLGKGIFVSNDSRATGYNQHDLIIAGSGGGKTGSIVYPQLKTITDSSLIVADTKNQLHRMFGKDLLERGYRVLTLDFVNPEGSCLYNPLDYVRRTEDGGYNEIDLMKISNALIPIRPDDRDPFWSNSARAVFEFFLSYCLEALPEEDHHMYAACDLYRTFVKEMGEYGFIDFIEENPESFAAKRYAQIKSMQKADRTIASIYGFVNTAIYPFDVNVFRTIFDPRLHQKEETTGSGRKKAACRDDILDISSLGREKTVLFLNISDTDRSADLVVNLFYTQALQTLVQEADRNDDGRLLVPVRILMDDFAAGTTIPDFDKIISVVRSRDIWLTMCIQSISQLESLYGREKSRTILNNCDHLVYMSGNDLDTAEFIGTRANKTPETILAMERSKEYLIEGGRRAILVDKISPYSDDFGEIRDAS